MIRLLLAVAFVAAPLIAGAHEGHHAHPKQDPAPAPSAERSSRQLDTVAIIAAPSRCPGGGHEVCCCHDATGTTSCHPSAVVDTGRREAAPAPTREEATPAEQPVTRAVAVVRFSPRGPPLLS